MEEEGVAVEVVALLEVPPEDDPEAPSEVPPEAGAGAAGVDFCSG